MVVVVDPMVVVVDPMVVVVDPMVVVVDPMVVVVDPMVVVLVFTTCTSCDRAPDVEPMFEATIARQRRRWL
jgi:hypothetical protein